MYTKHTGMHTRVSLGLEHYTMLFTVYTHTGHLKQKRFHIYMYIKNIHQFG